ncbi:MAG TPA: trehalose-phosphatase [Acidimicrobiales bacterium]|nr:trehalose-phosphatase [Acidimicrobiales bacterium]
MSGPGSGPGHGGHAPTDLPAPLRPFAAEPGTSALFLDFDGTLSGIVADPRDARPLPGVPDLLADLAGRFALVAVISGRPTAFLADVLGAPTGVTLAGLYGLERALHGDAYAHWAGVIDDVVDEARASAPPGVYVEPKGLTVTLHWRNAPDQRDWVVEFAERQHAAHDLLVHPGRHERELRPPLAVDKGTVVRALAAEHAAGAATPSGRADAGAVPLRRAAAFGDDIGDLPAFAALDELTDAAGRALDVVRIAAVDTESPPEVAAQAELTVHGATGAVALLRALADAAA